VTRVAAVTFNRSMTFLKNKVNLSSHGLNQKTKAS
jgi:hypothetical protein